MSLPHLTVLTGDIVKSSRLEAARLNEVISALQTAADQARSWDGAGAAAHFTRFRGDGWQCLAGPHTLRTALFLRASVRVLGRGFDTRISLGIGPGTVEGRDLSDSSGPAFELSGHGLDTMPRGARWAISGPSVTRQIEAVFTLCEELSRGWTPPQAAVLREVLPPGSGTQAEIGLHLGISQQMVAKHLAASGFRALDLAITVMEA